jgi:hypothetical protein
VTGGLTASMACAAPGADFNLGGTTAGRGFGGLGGGMGAPLMRANPDGTPADVLSWALNAGVTHSDNIGRTVDDRTSDSIAQVGLQLGVTDARPRLNTQLQVNLSYWDFVNHTFGSQLVGGANGGVLLTLLPERFTWIVHDNFGQIAADPTAVVTPGNMQNVNLFSTGPNINLPLGGSVNSLELQGLYSKANYGTTDQNNYQYLGSVALQHKLSPKMTVSLTGTDTHTVYEESVSGFDVREASLGLDAIGVRTSLSGAVGYTQLKYLGESHSGLLARLGLTRLIGSRSQLSLEVGTQYSDSATDFAQGQEFQGVQATGGGGAAAIPGGVLVAGGGPLLPGGTAGAPGGVSLTAVSTDPYKSDYASATWNLIAARTELSFDFTLRKETHQQETDFDRRLGIATVTLSRRLSPLLTVSANGTYTRQRFAQLDIDVNSWGLGAGLDWTLTRTIALQARFDRQDGSGTGPERNYTEDRIYVGISYSDGRRAR